MDTSALVDLALTWFTDQIALLAPYAKLEAAAALLLFLAVLIRHRRNRALRDELDELKGRLNRLEACEYRRVMQSLSRRPLDLNMTGLLTPPEDGTMFPIAPKMVSPEMTAQGDVKEKWDKASSGHPSSADHEPPPSPRGD